MTLGSVVHLQQVHVDTVDRSPQCQLKISSKVEMNRFIKCHRHSSAVASVVLVFIAIIVLISTFYHFIYLDTNLIFNEENKKSEFIIKTQANSIDSCQRKGSTRF